MPAELVAGWVIYEAYKLFVKPLATDAYERFISDTGDAVGAGLSERVRGWVGRLTDRAGSDGTPAGEPESELVGELEADPEAAEALRDELGRRVGVDLDISAGAPPKRGTDAWFVAAYDAILWRIAMLAVWEERPIAIGGTLQGPDWVTVCVPLYTGLTLIQPAEMWDRPDSRSLLRRRTQTPRVDFFVMRIADDAAREAELARLNRRFRQEPGGLFLPAPGASLADSWHRIDGVFSTWVRLQLDPETERLIRAARPLDGTLRPLGMFPAERREYPEEWNDLLDFDELGAIEALTDGADKFSRERDSLRERATALLALQPPA